MSARGERTERCIVQFMHPGQEVRPAADDSCQWNRADTPHTRRFMAADGQSVDRISNAPRSSHLAFWGEWEAQSTVLRTLQRSAPDDPRAVHAPFWRRVEHEEYPPRQNTDPFVFGDAFRYTGCKQWRRTGHGEHRAPTLLRDLADGSLILFGSKVRNRFVLDTAFVVAGSVLHRDSDWRTLLADRVPPTYTAVTLEPWYGWRSTGPFRLYDGASAAAPVHGLFSFTPCVSWSDESTSGFARPAVEFDGVINPKLMMGQRFTRSASRDQIAECWHAIADQVLDQGLQLGVRIGLPPERP